jgi:putative heme transporter
VRPRPGSCTEGRCAPDTELRPTIAMTAADASSGYPRVRPPTYRSLIPGVVLITLAVILFAAGKPLTPYLVGLVVIFILSPIVDRLNRTGMSRGLATIVVILGTLGILFVLAWLILGAVVEQGSALVASWPALSESLRARLAASNLPTSLVEPIDTVIATLPSNLATLAPDILQAVVVAVGSGIVGLASLVGVPFFIYYVMAERSTIVNDAYRLIPREYDSTFRDIFRIANRVFSAWARSQIALSASVGIPVFVGFTILGLVVDPFYGDYALLFGVIAFFTEFIPIVGAYIAMVPAAVIAFAAVGPIGAVVTILLFAVVQFFEGSVLVPRIQGSALEMPAAVVLIALVIGAALGGLIGALLALPITATLRSIIGYLYERAAGEVATPASA